MVRRPCHVAAVVLIIVAMDAAPEGAGNNAPATSESAERSMGRVLHRTGRESPPVATQVQAAEFAAAPTHARDIPKPVTTQAEPQSNPKPRRSKNSTERAAKPPNRHHGGDRQLRRRQGERPRVRRRRQRLAVHLRLRPLEQHGRPPLATAKKQLSESLQSLSSVHQFHIIFFNQKIAVVT